MIPHKWRKFLNYWNTGEWQVVDEELTRLTKQGVDWNPGRAALFQPLIDCPPEKVKCVIVGQDPYPDPKFAIGRAFGVPKEGTIPSSLAMIIKELQRDIERFPADFDISLQGWADQGVLLWNAIPSCEAWKSASHDWPEWKLLTQELIEKLSDKFIPFVFFGVKAREFSQFVNEDKSYVLTVSHPSPRGQMSSKSPFLGSRIFSTINEKLSEQNKREIDWRL